MKHQVNGNTEGIREGMLARLDSLYSYESEEDAFLPRELMKLLAECSCALNREIAVYLTRDGEIVNVAVGTDCDVELTDYRLRRNTERLSRVRCVHTHPDGDGRLSDVDLSALKIFRYDAMTAVGVKDGEPTFVQTAFLGEREELILPEPGRWYRVPDAEWMSQIELSDSLVGREEAQQLAGEKEKAVLMGIESEESLQELRRLAETAGAEVAGIFLQKRSKPDSALYIGRGRAEELARDCQALEADVCIFDEELTGMQARNLEEILRIKVIDRTTLILDIFSQRAASAEGKLQVELAQLQYRSARLIGMGTVLSRLAGGIGTRGPGESRLEMSRRRIRERMTELSRRLEELEKQRSDGVGRVCAGPAVRDAGRGFQADGNGGKDAVSADGHGGIYPEAAPHAGERLPVHAGGGGAGRCAGDRFRRVEPGYGSPARHGGAGAGGAGSHGAEAH